ncbi:integrase [Marinobacter nauticus]|uniref:Phage integrase family protein n=1 Tax=Marinobacter nauticus TaxID=2743 RepID=A0A833JU59_MARNT|nr:site-specific integrase [Marinobacter nauticus]KAE8546190.1 Phage integrase family protein [Marinobacter nauticus]
MATFQKRGNKWRAIVRRKGYKTVTKTHDTKAQAQRWAAQIEGNLEDQDTADSDFLLSDLVDRYLDELDQHKPPGRTKRATLEMIRRYLGTRRSSELTAQVLVDFFRDRATYCSPATVQQDLIYMRGLLEAAKHIWGARVNLKHYDTAATHCRRYGLVGKSVERDRRFRGDEYDRLLAHIDSNNYYRSPMGDIVRFAVGSCMRLGEITSIRWQDLDTVKKTIIIRSRKHPSQKAWNDQEVPLLGDTFAIIQRQPKTGDRIFPCQVKAISTAFRRALEKVGIEDMRFHDLRHEGISRLFEQGYGVMEVAKVSGHRDINQLRRYVQLKPEDLHDGPVRNRQGF